MWKMPHKFRQDDLKNGTVVYQLYPSRWRRVHRCSGEGSTVEMTKTAIKYLVTEVEYEVPEQDLSFSLSRMPTLPES